MYKLLTRHTVVSYEISLAENLRRGTITANVYEKTDLTGFRFAHTHWQLLHDAHGYGSRDAYRSRYECSGRGDDSYDPNVSCRLCPLRPSQREKGANVTVLLRRPMSLPSHKHKHN